MLIFANQHAGQSIGQLILCGLLWLLTPLSSFAEMEKAVDGSPIPSYVGGQVCVQCHQTEYRAWSGSHHDLAMQMATGETVLGNFDNISLLHKGVTSSFYKKDGKFMVQTEGPDGRPQDYEVKYTFGVEPLQQYLVEFPGGRLQALSLAWDTRPKEQGGQRWFDLYPGEVIKPDDELHWTQPSQNWNSMCAECHSTHLQKHYDPVTRTFSTTWSEIDVACEACHGPGAQHVVWAEQKPGWEQYKAGKGLKILLDERKDIQWPLNVNSGNAMRSQPRASDKEIDLCARCHSRRSPISADYVHGEPLLDHYRPRLLDAGMYHADGQIDDEVYVYGSFLQSKMYHAGVTCSDCHDPHSLSLRLPGNGVCLQCHQADKYDKQTHHFHEPGTNGASCAECHMPPKTYMVVDPRHDHSMRIPRPDLSVQLGTPNACNNCHKDKGAEWAAKQMEDWYGHMPSGFQTHASALHAAREQTTDAGKALVTLIRDPQAPAIARATALTQVAPHLSASDLDVLETGLADESPMVRETTLTLLESAPPAIRVRLAFPLLSDPVRAVRIEAARVLAGIPGGELSDDQQALLENGQNEYVAAQQAMAERPEAQTNLGNFHAAQGEFAEAVSAYKAALELNQRYVPAYANLADLYRSRGDETEAEKVLRQAVTVLPESGDIQHALGLSLVRQKRIGDAIESLEKAARYSPDNGRYVYVYAVALDSVGRTAQAILVLQGAHHQHPADRDILNALVTFHRKLGNEKAAREYAGKLTRLPR